MNKRKRTGRAARLLDNKGESLIYIFSIMLFLMIICSSVVTAAIANHGYQVKQYEYNQAIILDESIHKNIMYSLQIDPSDSSLLSRQLAEALYEIRGGNPFSPARLGTIELNLSMVSGTPIDLYNDGSITLQSVELSFPEQHVIINPSSPAQYQLKQVLDPRVVCNNCDGQIFPVPADPLDACNCGSPIPIPDNENMKKVLEFITPNGERRPKTINIISSMIVTVVIDANGKTIISRAYYQYSGGKLSDDPINYYERCHNDEDILSPTHGQCIVLDEHSCDVCRGGTDCGISWHYIDCIDENDDNMVFTHFGRWELIRYETIEA
ncbi:MAG: hypothetical protein FWG44_01150 [Oscillospiraceae bacterium]|nr:hypothetical protein [Oscillospiraceae bacterium]